MPPPSSRFKDEPANGIVLPDYGPAEELIAATGADIRFGGDRAFYCRPIPEGSWPNHENGDFISVPPKHRFNPLGAYYETVIHELAHWSEVRTGWDHQKQGYAMGELAAEIAARSSRPNSASRRARRWRTTPPTLGLG